MANYSSMVLVEGKSERMVLPELCRLCGIDKRFEIRQENSLSELKRALKTYLKSTNTLRKLWIIIDADTDFEAAWQSVKDILLQSGKYSFNRKMHLPKEGFIIEPVDKEDLIVGIWIMPNNQDVGMLEDFMLRLIPDSDALLPIAHKDIEKLEKERVCFPGIFKSVHKSKAEIYTWLSWHDTPGESLSVAVQKRLFATDKALCRLFAKWIDVLNDEET